MSDRYRNTFRIFRVFSITRLTSILVAALTLTWVYRHEAVNRMVSYGEKSSLVHARSLLNPVREELNTYLAAEVLHHSELLLHGVVETIHRAIENTDVVICGSA